MEIKERNDFYFLINERIKKLKWGTEEGLEKQGEKIGEIIFFIHEDICCLQHYYNFFREKADDYKGVKYISIFNHFVRLFWDRLYLNISKLLDKRKDVMSIKNFMKKFGNINEWSYTCLSLCVRRQSKS